MGGGQKTPGLFKVRTTLRGGTGGGGETEHQKAFQLQRKRKGVASKGGISGLPWGTPKNKTRIGKERNPWEKKNPTGKASKGPFCCNNRALDPGAKGRFSGGQKKEKSRTGWHATPQKARRKGGKKHTCTPPRGWGFLGRRGGKGPGRRLFLEKEGNRQ